MRILWLCNGMPGAVRRHLTGGSATGGTWTDNVLDGLRQRGETLRILFPGKEAQGSLEGHCSYAGFREGLPYVYLTELEGWFRKELEDYRPEAIHIWGTEYGHTLAMVNAAEAAGLLDQTVVSIQGLVSVCARHYNEGVPYRIQKAATFRDLVRRDNLLQQQEKFARRGILEEKALKKARHVIGRTSWDAACTGQIHPERTYHFCNETLRQPFYEDRWSYAACKKHHIFISASQYPVKGMHYLLEAMGQVLKTWPDATVSVPGQSFFAVSKLRQTSYQKYLARLARDNGLADKITFLGKLSAEEMKQAFLEANVFVLPSTVENSPNSLGEAMLLGVPCVAADVGGVSDLMTHNREGYVYPSTAPYMLAHYIGKVFSMEDEAEALGREASGHARKTHDPEINLQTLMDIYKALT